MHTAMDNHHGHRGHETSCEEIAACGENHLVRARYFYSMLLEAEDLAVDSRFHLENIRNHDLERHGAGTVCGLKVDDNRCAFQVEIHPGVAIDCRGREIRIDEKIVVDIREAAECAFERIRRAEKEREGVPMEPRPSRVPIEKRKDEEEQREEDECKPGWTTLYLGICYQEQNIRPVQSLGGPETCCEPGCEMSRTQHGFCVFVSDTRPRPPKKDPLVDLEEEIRNCPADDLREWLCRKVISGCWRCEPDPCGERHDCLTLASIRVNEDGRVDRPDNCRHRRLVLPTRLIAELAIFAALRVTP